MMWKSVVSPVVSLILLAASSPLMHADPLTTTFTVNGSNTLLVETAIANGEQFVYSDLTQAGLNSRDITFTATYEDVAGLQVLNVTDVCAQVTVFGDGIPCEAFAFTFSDASFADVTVLADVNANVFATGNVASVNFDASVASGSGSFNFSNPGAVTTTPEPGSVALLATGLLGIGGVVRRKLSRIA